MLKRIRLKDFKSFVDEEVKLAPLTLLVGANASGKSNFLDALRVLRGTAFDLTLGKILHGENRATPDAWAGIRGKAEEVARFGKGIFTVESFWDSPGLAESFTHHSITCSISPYVCLVDESLNTDTDSLQLTASEDGFIEIFPGAKVGSESSLISGINQLYRQGFVVNLPVFAAAARLSGFIESLTFLSIKPSEMRDFGRRGDPLGEDGHNLSGVLADLCEDTERKQSLVHWLAELCAPEIEDIDILKVRELGDVMAMFVEKGGKRISARSVSDGTLHFLGTLLALRTAEPGSVILIEEIETGLHPTRIRLLVEYLETVTRERDIQVIATTHSPVVLQWLSDETLRNTVVFGRVPEHEGTIMRRLGDLPHFEEVIQKKGIEELFSTGWLEMAL